MTARERFLLSTYPMPAEIVIDVEMRVVFTICSGTVTDDEFLQARAHILADPRFDSAFDRLWDFSAVTREEVSEATIAELVRTSPQTGDILRAVVVSMSPQVLTRAMEFVAQSRRFNRRIAAFPTRAAAVDWIKSERIANDWAAGSRTGALEEAVSGER